MSLAMGSVAVSNVTAVPVPLAATSPGSLVFTNTGANPITLGGPGVTAATVGPGTAAIPAGATVSLARVGGAGGLFAISAVGASVLNWFYGTEISP